MKNIALCLITLVLSVLVISCNNDGKQGQTADYTEIDSIARVDAQEFVKTTSKGLTEMQLEDEILKFKSKQYSIGQEQGTDISNRYGIKFKERVKAINDSIGHLFDK